MLRLAHIADSHFDETSRFAECERVHQWIANDVAKRNVDLVVHSGDVYERKSTPRERLEAARFFQRLADVAPVVVVRGNHDVLGDLMLLERLEATHPITVVEGAFTVHAGGFVVGCLAWPSKASILALGAQSHAEGELLASEALRNVIRGLGQEMARHDGPRILLAHAMVRGSVTSTGQPLVGCDLEVGLEDIALANADYVALGHIHKQQDWEDGVNRPVCPIVYPGSPRRTAYGEIERKGYALAEFEGKTCLGWTHIETPCAPMILVEDEWGQVFDDQPQIIGWQVGDGVDEGPCVQGAEVRFRYKVDADRREAARGAAHQRAQLFRGAGAIDVKVEEVVKPKNAARAPEVAQATTLADKMLALWRARRTTPEGARRERLLTKLAGLEAKAS